MRISLRPHHFLCLKGYKGLNYNKTQAKSWDIIHTILKEYPKADILIVEGKDDLCHKCPAKVSTNSFRCQYLNVEKLDESVKKILNITTGGIYKYKEIMQKLNKTMTKEKHEKLCSLCSWWKKGLCRNSFID